MSDSTQSRKTILYIACSLDGYIAQPNDDLSFLSQVQKEGEDYGYNEFLQRIDTVIMGRRTYDWVMNQVEVFPHEDLETFIISRTDRPSKGHLKFYSGDLKKLITELKNKKGKNIFIDGGAQIVHELLNEKLIDEIILSIIPVLVGDGIPLFKNGRPQQGLKLIHCQSYEKGLIQLYYRCLP